MTWLSENWIWVAGALLVVFLIYLFTRPRQPQRRSGASLGLSSVDERTVAFLVARISASLQSVVDETVGSHYSSADRQKIAVGMVAIMATDGISLDRIASDGALFGIVMLKSIATLTHLGEITAR